MSRSDYVLLYFMWICKMVTKTLIFDCERFKMGKKIKGCWIYVRLFWVYFINCMVKVTQTHCLFLTEDQLADSQLRQHNSLPVQLSVSRHSQKNCTNSQSHHLCCLLAEIHWNEKKKKIELHSDCLVEQYRRESFG